MTHRIRLAGAATFVALLALAVAPAPAAPKVSCVRAGGTATSPTTAIATFMAEAALKNSIEAHGRKQVGPTSVKCDGQALGPTCVAKAKACK